MLDHLSVIHLQIIIAPCEKVMELLHEIGVVLLDLWAEHFRVLLNLNVAVFHVLFV
jgi:hypothetical protein